MRSSLCPPGWVLPVNGSLKSIPDSRGTTVASSTRSAVWLCPYAKRKAYRKSALQTSNFVKRRNGMNVPEIVRPDLPMGTGLRRRLTTERANTDAQRRTVLSSAEGKGKSEKNEDEVDDDTENQEIPARGKDDREDRETMEGMAGDMAEVAENVENVSADWDASWNELKNARSGGVFSFPSDDPISKQTESDIERIDRRTEQLTSLWTNENGYLVGILVLFGILAFYIYVYQTGGIRH